MTIARGDRRGQFGIVAVARGSVIKDRGGGLACISRWAAIWP
jgi:hypothetical protein